MNLLQSFFLILLMLHVEQFQNQLLLIQQLVLQDNIFTEIAITVQRNLHDVQLAITMRQLGMKLIALPVSQGID